jgi:hypothetical protein
VFGYGEVNGTFATQNGVVGTFRSQVWFGGVNFGAAVITGSALDLAHFQGANSTLGENLSIWGQDAALDGTSEDDFLGSGFDLGLSIGSSDTTITSYQCVAQ